MDQSKEALIKSKKISTEELIKLDLKNEPIDKTTKPSFVQRKYKRIKSAFSGFWVAGKTGFLMGSIVGCTMGFIFGCVSAYQSKTLIVIPLSMATSGFFFGSLMCVGSILRNEEIERLEGSEGFDYSNIYFSMKYDEMKNEYLLVSGNERRI